MSQDRLPRIASALGYLSDKLIEGAIDYRPNRRRTYEYIAIAACTLIVFAAGFGIFSLKLRFTARQPDPLKDSTNSGLEVITDVTDETEPTLNDSTQNYETTTPWGDMNVPPPFGEGADATGGDENRFFFDPCIPQFDDIPAELMRLVPSEELSSWLESYVGTKVVVPDSIDDYANIYTFITDFNLSREQTSEALEYYLYTDDIQLKLPSELLDWVYSGDIESITENCAQKLSIVVGSNIYSPYWVYSHTVDDYTEAGIEASEIWERSDGYLNFNLTDEARAAFEEKISQTLRYDYGALYYVDGTIVNNSDVPLVQKEFTLIGVEYGEYGDIALYLIPNDKSDENIYAVLFMWDQLIALGCDSAGCLPAEEAIFRTGGYYSWNIPKPAVPVGAVVRIAWDGYAEKSGDIRRLCWASRIQFSDSDTVYSSEELDWFVTRLESTGGIDASEFADIVVTKGNCDDNYEKIGGTEPYEIIPSAKLEYYDFVDSMLRRFTPETVEQTSSQGYIYLDASERYCCTGYILTGDEFAEYMRCAKAEQAPIVSQVPDGVTAMYGDLLGTDAFFTGDFKLYDEAPSRHYEATNLESRTALWYLGPNDEFVFARYSGGEIEMPNGKTFYGWLYRRVVTDEFGGDQQGGETENDTKDTSEGQYPQGLEFLNSIKYEYNGDYIMYSGEKYCLNPYIPTLENCNNFIGNSEFVGESHKKLEPSEDLEANILIEGCDVYFYGDFILVMFSDPQEVGSEFTNGGDEAKVKVYGRLYRKYIKNPEDDLRSFGSGYWYWDENIDWNNILIYNGKVYGMSQYRFDESDVANITRYGEYIGKIEEFTDNPTGELESNVLPECTPVYMYKGYLFADVRGMEVSNILYGIAFKPKK